MQKTVEQFKTKYPGVFFTKSMLSGKKGTKVFHIRYRYKGKRIVERAGCEVQDGMTAKKASEKRTAILRGEIAPAKYQKPEENNRWTISKLFEYYKVNRANYKGLDREKHRFTLYIEPEFGGKEPAEIVALDIARFRKTLLEKKKLAPQTVKNTLEYLRRIINYGVKNQLIPPHSLHFEMPEVDNIIDESLTRGQLKRLWEVLEAHPMESEAWIMKILVYTGRRPAEICRLEWTDIDMERQTFTLKDTKTKKTEQLAFSDRVKRLFESIPRFHNRYLFLNSDGSPKTRLDYGSRRYKKLAELPENIRPAYCLRHTFASIAASNDIPERPLKALMGHSHKAAKQDITSRYAHVSHERLLQAANQIAGYIDGIVLEKENVIQISGEQ